MPYIFIDNTQVYNKCKSKYNAQFLKLLKVAVAVHFKHHKGTDINMKGHKQYVVTINWFLTSTYLQLTTSAE